MTIAGFAGLELPELVIRAGLDPLDMHETLVDEDPCSGRAFAEVPIASAADVDAMVDVAWNAFRASAWRDLAPLQRERLLHRWADAIECDLPRLAALEALDTGKPVSQAAAIDIPAAVSWLRTYAGWPSKLIGTSGGLAATPGDYHCYSRREPVGVVAAITPWNFPIVLSMWKIAPALAAGCTVILKPAPETPLSALRLGEIAREVGFPVGVFQVATGDATTGAALASHPRVAKVAFTGSTATGQAILKASVPDFKRVTLELGGKSPSIICKDAELEKAIPQAAMACFFNSGQVCYAGTRLYVHRSIYDAVFEGIGAVGRSQRMGPSFDPTSQLGPLISARHHEKVSGFVERAAAAGIESVGPAIEVPDHGYYFPPTIFRNVAADAEISRHEVFGPVLATAPFDELDEAIALANDCDYGLASHVWTRDLSTAHHAAGRLDSGTVFVNCILLADPAFPFGGVKRSGLGRENGPDVFGAYLEPKTVVVAL